MAHTTSLSFPSMFDVARNRVATKEDSDSVTNRTRLLILSEPTSLYNNPKFGVGLKRHLFKYNNANEKAIIKDRIIAQLKINEPYVDASKTQFADGLMFTGSSEEITAQDYQKLKLTCSVSCKFGGTEEVELNF